MKRRKFIRRATVSGLLLAGSRFPLQAFAGPEITKLTILHTNDVHSRVDPFPMDGGRYQGIGGAVRRAGLIQSIRAKEEHVLLVDSGDIFQGTPYFNYYGGEIEFKLMSQMRYDAATIGNHDFDGGIDGLHKQLPHASFPLVCSNYDFSDTIMHESVKPYLIKQKGDIKIGLLGVGIELEGLVPQSLYKGTRYLDPITKANEIATLLKQEEKCDLVICLSHLGYQYRHQKVSDVVLAQASENIDIILGGHTHTFLEEPHILANAKGDPVWINQAGWGGIMLGRMDVLFEQNRRGKCVSCENVLVKETEQG